MSFRVVGEDSYTVATKNIKLVRIQVHNLRSGQKDQVCLTRITAVYGQRQLCNYEKEHKVGPINFKEIVS